MSNNSGIAVFSFYKRPVAGSGQERIHIENPIVLDADSCEEESDDGGEDLDSDFSYEENESESAERSTEDQTDDECPSETWG